MSTIVAPVLKKFNDAVLAATTFAVTTEPVSIAPSPPITLATIREVAVTEVFLNSILKPVSAATELCSCDLISPLVPLIE